MNLIVIIFLLSINSLKGRQGDATQVYQKYTYVVNDHLYLYAECLIQCVCARARMKQIMWSNTDEAAWNINADRAHLCTA